MPGVSISAHEVSPLDRRRLAIEPLLLSRPPRPVRRRGRAPAPPPSPPPPERDSLLQRSLLLALLVALGVYGCRHGCGRPESPDHGSPAEPAPPDPPTSVRPLQPGSNAKG